MLTICETMLVGVGENDAVYFLKTAHTKKEWEIIDKQFNV